MGLTTQTLGSVEVIMPDGPIADPNIAELSNCLHKHYDSATPRVVLYLAEVPYLDSEGIEMLIGIASSLQERNLHMKLAGVPTTCCEILNLTGTIREFELFVDVQDAVRSFM
jgi:anti-anti-sigma factor